MIPLESPISGLSKDGLHVNFSRVFSWMHGFKVVELRKEVEKWGLW